MSSRVPSFLLKPQGGSREKGKPGSLKVNPGGGALWSFFFAELCQVSMSFINQLKKRDLPSHDPKTDWKRVLTVNSGFNYKLSLFFHWMSKFLDKNHLFSDVEPIRIFSTIWLGPNYSRGKSDFLTNRSLSGMQDTSGPPRDDYQKINLSRKKFNF